MIVNRRTFYVKPEQVDAAVQWIQNVIADERARGEALGHARVYVAQTGRFGQVAFEAEYESMAEYERFMAEWFARPENVKANNHFITLLDSGGTNQIWRRIE